MNFEISPFGVPHSFDRAKDIKTVVSKSFSFQKQFRVSNACLVVNLILKRCFDALGIPNRKPGVTIRVPRRLLIVFYSLNE